MAVSLLPQRRPRRTRLFDARKAFGAHTRPLVVVLLVVLAAVFAFPFVWAVLSSFKGPEELFRYPPQVFASEWRWSNYVEVFQRIPLARYALNTFIVGGLSVVGDLVSCSLVAYGFARYRFPFKSFLFVLVLSGLMLPDEVLIIPQFLVFRSFGWLDTLRPLVFPAFVAYSAFNVFLLRQFFLQVPRDLDEAAMMDGAGPLRVLWSVYLPLSKPALATVAIFSFLYHWNDFLRPLIYLNSQENFTLTLGLQAFAGAATNTSEAAQHLLMSAAVLMTLPIAALFFAAQRYFIEGMALSGVKR